MSAIMTAGAIHAVDRTIIATGARAVTAEMPRAMRSPKTA
jgi:hypothetical protein